MSEVTVARRAPADHGGPAQRGPVTGGSPRRKTSLSVAAALGLMVLSGCASAPMETRRCVDMVGSGQHSHRMVQVPCPAEPAQ